MCHMFLETLDKIQFNAEDIIHLDQKLDRQTTDRQTDRQVEIGLEHAPSNITHDNRPSLMPQLQNYHSSCTFPGSIFLVNNIIQPPILMVLGPPRGPFLLHRVKNKSCELFFIYYRQQHIVIFIKVNYAFYPNPLQLTNQRAVFTGGKYTNNAQGIYLRLDLCPF